MRSFPCLHETVKQEKASANVHWVQLPPFTPVYFPPSEILPQVAMSVGTVPGHEAAFAQGRLCTLQGTACCLSSSQPATGGCVQGHCAWP